MSLNGASSPEDVWVVVPAAGVGARMGCTLPKQYVRLAGIEVLQRSVDTLLSVASIKRGVIVLREGDRYWSGLPASRDNRLQTVHGASSRATSVAAGVAVVREQAGDDVWVLVHDAARPMVAAEDVQRLIDTVMGARVIGGVLGIPVQDTLKQVDASTGCERTVDRNRLWQAQTPQMFRAGELGDALQSALRDPRAAITDEASVFERLGRRPLLVGSFYPNFKITWPRDIELAEALLAAAARKQAEQTTVQPGF